MTAIAEAFAKIGKLSPQKRLEKMALVAIEESAGYPAAKAAFLHQLMKDAGAMKALLGEAVTTRAAAYLHEIWLKENDPARVHVREHDRAARGLAGHHPSETQGGAVGNGGGHGSTGTHTKNAPAANSPERRRAAKARMSWFDKVVIRGRKIGDITYREMERAAAVSLHDGISNLHHSYVMRKLCRSVPYSPAIDDLPAREWADEKTIEAANVRWTELVAKIPRLSIEEVDAVLRLEQANA